MKRENIFISEDYTKKRVAAVKFVAPGDVPEFDCSIHFGEEGNAVTMQNCIIKDNLIVNCSPEDTYDFETGALIALMKMCGKDKVIKACDELYKDDNYKNALQETTENNEKLIEENNYLKYVISCRESAIESLENTRDLLIEENEKLKLDCEKLQHGYNDMIFCGGRQNGKQYTFLVELFKKIDQKKVDAAYKEAYNTTLPVWQERWLNEAYSFLHIKRTEDPEKIFYRRMDEVIKKTKREEMWNDILACGDCKHSKYVEVKKEDLEAFAKECNEKKIFSISGYEFHTQEFWFADDGCIFQIFRKPAGFICAKSVGFAYEDTIVDYLPPMRWDLFEKGRKIVRVTPKNIDDFIVKCTNKFGSIIKPVLKRYKDFTHAFIMISDYHYDNKPTIHIMTPEDLVRNQHENPKKYSDKKIVDWEDVR